MDTAYVPRDYDEQDEDLMARFTRLIQQSRGVGSLDPLGRQAGGKRKLSRIRKPSQTRGNRHEEDFLIGVDWCRYAGCDLFQLIRERSDTDTTELSACLPCELEFSNSDRAERRKYCSHVHAVN